MTHHKIQIMLYVLEQPRQTYEVLFDYNPIIQATQSHHLIM